MASVIEMRSSEVAGYVHSGDIPVATTARRVSGGRNNGSRSRRHTAVEPKTGEPAVDAFPFGITQKYCLARMTPSKEVCPLPVMWQKNL